MKNTKKRREQLILPSIIFAIIFCLAANGAHAMKRNPKPQPETEPMPQPYEWPVSNPEEQGLHSNIISNAMENAATKPYLHSLVIIRNGYLVGEGYFHGYGKFDARNIHSASKSVTAMLIGIALKEKYLSGLDQKMMDFFPEYQGAGMDPRKYEISIRHLLEMTSGLGAYQGDQGLPLLSTADPIGNSITGDIFSNPGEVWNYFTPGTHILRGIIKKSTGMTTREFAQHYLFDPLGITPVYWRQDAMGYYMGNIQFYPGDMARLGYLYLNNGLLGDKQIIDPEYVNLSIQPHNIPVFTSGFDEEAYGYQWWVGKLSGFHVYAAMGWGGQNIFCVPDLKLVIVTTADSQVDLQLLTINELEIVELVKSTILNAAAVLGPAPYFPLDVKVRRLENRSLFLFEFIDQLTWNHNPRNLEQNIVKYRLYRVSGENRTLLSEIEASGQSDGFRYWVRPVPRFVQYVYGITSVTGDGTESSISTVIVNRPED